MDLSRFSRLRTARLDLSPPAEADPDALAASLNDFEVTRWLSRVPYPYARADAEEFIARAGAEPPAIWLIHDKDGLAGGVGLDGHLGYWLTGRAWGRGYATEAARAVLMAHFADPQAGHVGSSYFTGNDASARVLAKLGFQEVGPNREYSRSQDREVEGIALQLTRAAHEVQPVFTLRTRRLILDKLTEADLPAVHAEWGDPGVARMTATVQANWTRAEALDWITTRARQSMAGCGLAIRRGSDRRLLGTLGFGGTPVNMGYLLGRDHWGKGYATEAATAFLTAAYRQLPDLDVIEAGVFDDNPASARVLQKLGFDHQGAGACQSVARVEPAANSLYRLTRASFEART